MLKQVSIAVFLSAFALQASGTPGALGQGTANAQAEVADAVAQLTMAYGANDIEGYFAAYSPDMTWWAPMGRWDKASYLDYWTEYIETTGGLTAAANSDVQIAVAPSGEMAVASYLLSATRANPGDAAPTVYYQMSLTMVKRDGGWTIVHTHFQGAPAPVAEE